MQKSTLSKNIRNDWGTIKRFAEKNNLNYQYVRNTLAGQTDIKIITQTLIEMGYIASIDDLKKAV